LTNARDAINLRVESGTGTNQRIIVVKSYTEGDRVVAVSDTGIGIDPALKN